MSRIRKRTERQRHWIKLGMKLADLYLKKSDNDLDFIVRIYDSIANHYDETWTNQYHDLTDDMISRLSPPNKSEALDLFCGTGFVTSKLAELTNGHVIGVDASKEMLNVARRNHGKKCKLVHSDVMEYLCSLPPQSVDVITCAWGLGYSYPSQVLNVAF